MAGLVQKVLNTPPARGERFANRLCGEAGDEMARNMAAAVRVTPKKEPNGKPACKYDRPGMIGHA